MAIHLLSNSQGHLVGEWVDNGPGKNSGGKKTARVVRVNYDSNSTWELALGERYIPTIICMVSSYVSERSAT